MPTYPFVYVGTYSEPILFGTGQVLQGKGIYLFRLDAEQGALEPLAIKEGVRNSSYLAFDPARKFLYCVNEFKEYEGKASGAVSAFHINPETGALTHLNTKASHGTDPCHLIVDKTSRNVLVANFASGSVCVLPIDADGSLKEASCVIQHELFGRRPEAAGRAARACGRAFRRQPLRLRAGARRRQGDDLRFDAAAGKLTPNKNQPFVKVAPGAGPRQLVMHPNGKLAFLIKELNSTMTSYRYDPEEGTLAEVQTLSTLPGDFKGHSTCAEVQIHPNGTFLYGSNRGHDSIVIYAVDPEAGTLSVVGHESTRGKTPRNFAVSPNGEFLAAANQDSNNVVMFRIDPETGKLTPSGNVVEAGTPICVRFM